MSGIIGHTIYGLLGLQALSGRNAAAAATARSNLSAYLCGCYLGCDVMTLPGSVCVACGAGWGYCHDAPKTCGDCGGATRPYRLAHDGGQVAPPDVHLRFYGRSHLVFGWREEERQLAVSWEGLSSYAAAACRDARAMFGERALAYVLGWLNHVVGDAMIKSVAPGVSLQLLDGVYTPRNRPLQDLFAFHQVGVDELGIDWGHIFEAIAGAPVEPVQDHYMRVAKPNGRLAEIAPEGWDEKQRSLLTAVMCENRRYQTVRNQRLLETMLLRDGACHPDLAAASGVDRYRDVVLLCRRAGLREALDVIAQTYARLVEQSFVDGETEKGNAPCGAP